MNRYLTEMAKENRKWHIPVAILSAILGVVAVQTWIEDSPADEDFVIWLIAHLVVTGLMLWPLFHVVRWKFRQHRAGIIAARLAKHREISIPLAKLDRILGVRDAEKKIEDLSKRGFLQRLEVGGGELLLDNPGSDPDMQEEQPSQEEKPAADDIIGQIRYLNDEIDDEGVSERIERIEHATAGILQTIREHPERAEDARRFMNYYLPTTLKLLESYRLMEKQSYQGDNIQVSRRRIEAVLDKLVAATERQQDKLFRFETLNVEAEIDVLETMMTSDGLLTPDSASGNNKV